MTTEACSEGRHDVTCAVFVGLAFRSNAQWGQRRCCPPPVPRRQQMLTWSNVRSSHTAMGKEGAHSVSRLSAALQRVEPSSIFNRRCHRQRTTSNERTTPSSDRRSAERTNNNKRTNERTTTNVTARMHKRQTNKRGVLQYTQSFPSFRCNSLTITPTTKYQICTVHLF